MQIKSPILLLLAVILLVPTSARADAVLFIYPTEVIFEDNRRSAEITLTNRGDQTGTFEMGWNNMTMMPEGGLKKLEEQPPWSVQPFVRYSPRRVRLEPSESQVVKIALRRGSDTPEGEYYSHFRVLTLNSEDPLADGAEAAPSGVSIQARTAIAIPIIWRNSRTTPSASIESVRTDEDTNELTVTVRRHGLLSTRGYLHVFEAAPNDNRNSLNEPIPLIIYPSIEERTMAITLKDGVIATSLPRGTSVYYSPDLNMTDKSIVFASLAIVP